MTYETLFVNKDLLLIPRSKGLGVGLTTDVVVSYPFSGVRMSMPGRRVYASLGSVSSGTHREKDLLEAFGSILQRLVRRAELVGVDVNSHTKEVDEQSQALATLMDREGGERWWDIIWKDESFSHFLNEELFDALEEFSPPCCYFGAHEGDGADFGFWWSQENFDDSVEQGDIAKVSDLDEFKPIAGMVLPSSWSDDQDPGSKDYWDGPKWVAHVSDHGNIELYRYRLSSSGELEYESVVSVV